MTIGEAELRKDQADMDMLSRIYRYLKASGESRTGLGRKALRDPNFVWDLERGRIPTIRTERRVSAWLDRQEGGAR